MGNILFELGSINEAKAAYLKAIFLNKDSFFAYNKPYHNLRILY